MAERRAPVRITDYELIAWLAGYLEGEGSFMTTSDNVVVSLQTTDRDIAVRLSDLLNATVYASGKRAAHHKQAYILRITGARATYCMALVAPYMGTRRAARIDECLRVRESRRESRRSLPQHAQLVSDESLKHAWRARPPGTSLREFCRGIGIGRSSVSKRLNRMGFAVSKNKRLQAPTDLLAAIDGAAYPPLEAGTPFAYSWLAGLLEGEGCFLMVKGRPRVFIQMTDEDVIARFATLTSATYSRVEGAQAHWKALFRVTLSGARAEALMRAVNPYLGERRRTRIAQVLDHCARFRKARESRQCADFNIRYPRQAICERWTGRQRGESLSTIAAEFSIGLETLRRRLTEWGVYEGKPSATTRVGYRLSALRARKADDEV